MSHRPIARSPDLLRLQNEGYDLEERGGYLLVEDVPYVNAQCVIKRGIFICQLALADDVAQKPGTHVAFWTGEHPCHADGRKLVAFENNSAPQNLGNNIRADFTFSAKADYRDYHHKVTTYLGRIIGEAQKIDPSVTAQTFPVIAPDEGESVFNYVDTATSRAGIGVVNEKVAGQKIAFAGLGGSGSYALDLVTKTLVAEIHLFDGDMFSQHNAFRAPGAPSGEQLRAKPKKVHHFEALYAPMRKGIVPHDVYLGAENVALLDGFDFVFLCMEAGDAKRAVVEYLTAKGTPFVEVGLGVTLDDEQLSGLVRVVTSMPQNRTLAARHISYTADDGGANEYATNIQIAELNALSAVLAVLAWKKLFGVYRDATKAFYTGYSIATGEIVTETSP